MQPACLQRARPCGHPPTSSSMSKKAAQRPPSAAADAALIGRSKRKRRWGSWISSLFKQPSFYVVLVAIAIAIISYITVKGGKNSFTSNKTSSTKTSSMMSDKNGADNVPDYDQYVAMSKEKGWAPYDPVDKLEHLIRQYSVIFKINIIPIKSSSANPSSDKSFNIDTSETESIMKAIQKEIVFILQIIKKSPKKEIDLTHILQLSLESAHSNIYRIIKERLAVNLNVMITKARVESMASHWIYFPVQELLKFAIDKQSNPMPNVTLDLNRLFGPQERNALEIATQYRLYRIMLVLAQLGVDIGSSINIAILNGDDYAAEILLHALKLSPTPTKIDIILDAIKLATELSYNNILNRLNVAMENLVSISDSGFTTSEGMEVGAIPSYNEYLPVSSEPYDSIGVVSTDSSRGGSVLGKFMNAFSSSSSNHINDDLSVDITYKNMKKCAIDYLNTSAETGDFFNAFRDVYARRNRPVMFSLRAVIGDSRYAALKTAFSIESLRASSAAGDTNVMVSKIPYAKIFNRNSSTVSMKTFLENTTAYTVQLKAALDILADDKSGYDVGDVKHVIKNSANAFKLFVANDSYSNTHTLTLLQAESAPEYLFAGGDESTKPFTSFDFADFLKDNRGFASLLESVNEKIKFDPLRDDFNSNIFENLKYQFYLGGVLTGAPLHSHGPAINALLSGRKQWLLLPPSRDVYSTMHPLAFALAGGLEASYYPYSNEQDFYSSHGGPCYISQSEGEVLFVPRHFSHQTLNTKLSSGFAVEFLNYIH